MWIAQYIVDDITENTEIIGVFSTVDRAELAVADVLIDRLELDIETPTGMILNEYSDRYMIEQCTVNYNYMVQRGEIPSFALSGRVASLHTQHAPKL